MSLMIAATLIGNLIISGSFPTTGLPYGCDSQVQAPLTVPALTVGLFYFGPTWGIKFATGKPGQHFVFILNVPVGTYQVVATVRSGKVPACRDTSLVKVVTDSGSSGPVVIVLP